MKKALLSAAAGLLVVTSMAGAAEARCYGTGHHWSCGYHRLHYGHRVTHRSLAAGYGYRYGYPRSYGYGWSSPYYGSSAYGGGGFGPPPYSGGGP